MSTESSKHTDYIWAKQGFCSPTIRMVGDTQPAVPARSGWVKNSKRGGPLKFSKGKLPTSRITGLLSDIPLRKMLLETGFWGLILVIIFLWTCSILPDLLGARGRSHRYLEKPCGIEDTPTFKSK